MTAPNDRPRARRSSKIVAVVSVLMAIAAAEIVALVSPPSAQAIICVGIGRVIGVSDCFGGGYRHFPPPYDYAPLPQDYQSAAPSPSPSPTPAPAP